MDPATGGITLFPVLGQSTGPLTDADPTIQLSAALVGGVVALSAAYYASAAPEFKSALGLYLLGAVAAAATGFVRDGLDAAPWAVSLYFIVGSLVVMYPFRRGVLEVGLWGGLAGLGAIGFFVTANAKTAAFALAAAISVFAALKVINSPVLVHATVWLATSLMGVAGIYLSLGAEFIAVIQVLIYVGAVVTLFLFTVMLTIPEDEAHGLDDLDLPPGVTIESVVDLEEATPRFGVGPHKDLTTTNPRKPARAPPTLYGVSITDGVYGDETTKRLKDKNKEEA